MPKEISSNNLPLSKDFDRLLQDIITITSATQSIKDIPKTDIKNLYQYSTEFLKWRIPASDRITRIKRVLGISFVKTYKLILLSHIGKY
jgi:hypothetical protein